jgi:hypothetical protein
MHGINAEFATAVRGICADFQKRCAELRKFSRGFRLALAIAMILSVCICVSVLRPT